MERDASDSARRPACFSGCENLVQPPGFHVVHVAVDRHGRVDQWVLPDAGDVLDDGALLIGDRVPLDVAAFRRTALRRGVAKALRRQLGILERARSRSPIVVSSK